MSAPQAMVQGMRVSASVCTAGNGTRHVLEGWQGAANCAMHQLAPTIANPTDAVFGVGHAARHRSMLNAGAGSAGSAAACYTYASWPLLTAKCTNHTHCLLLGRG